MNCPYCGKQRIRRSRLRSSDFPDPLIGRVPMRCRECGDRFFAWLPQVFLAMWMGEGKRDMNSESRKHPWT